MVGVYDSYGGGRLSYAPVWDEDCGGCGCCGECGACEEGEKGEECRGVHGDDDNVLVLVMLRK
jgi:hypothetical protein